MSAIPSDLDNIYRDTKALSKKLFDRKGVRVAPATLNTLRTRGGGPPFRKFGRIPLYRLKEALDWVDARMSMLRHSTSETDTHQSNN
jgi:hypothetical protein